MALDVEIKKMTLNFTKDKVVKYVASANRGNVVQWDKLVNIIHLESGIAKQQVRSVIATLVDSMAVYLSEGHGVRLDDFGTFLPAVVSDSADTADKAGVKRVKVTFMPSKALRDMVSGISISTENQYVSSGGSGDSGGVTPPSGGGGELE
ncbi:HU family DNA-binding protein [Bacteroides sp.]|uniref:HU family DNA-binding protein n=1 Tax=Bacteroides sp. TaxID=29523 RepID=UPI00262CB3BD|nr:HU family DNA-binding protein [Bacteroides sp.]MDD3037939.1 HU family DNA-binding protein [Bacteroides sp.]